jgi:serine/threonine protein kinase
MLREDGHLKLTDFGIASAAREDPSLTRSGVLVGTPRSMSPEQIQGDPPAPSFDLYALGCIGLELITGKPTFPERDVMKLMLRKATWKIPTQRKLGAPISNELYTVLKSCLAREPEKRQLDFALLKSWSQSVDPALVSNLLKNTDTSADTVDAGNFDDPSSDSFF